MAERVCELVPNAEQVRFCTSGTEATMYAVRLARGFTGRNIILKIKGGWHGANTDLMVDVAAPDFIGAVPAFKYLIVVIADEKIFLRRSG